MSRNQRRPVLMVTLRLVITLLFVPAILDKFIDPGEWARLFSDVGLSTMGSNGDCPNHWTRSVEDSSRGYLGQCRPNLALLR
jgi:hypothetical protein